MKYIVSDEHKFIYFVLPKAACTSIKTALLPLFDPDANGSYDAQDNYSTRTRIHKYFDSSGHQINKGQFIRNMDTRYRDYFKFAIVRNPWDRLVSCYVDKLAEESRPGMKAPCEFAERVYSGMPFAEFVEIVHETPDDRTNNHLRSQCSVICGWDDDRPILTDFLGTFENLASDFDFVAEKIGDSRVKRLPHLMRSRDRSSYREFYDDKLKNLVYERYAEDIEKLGYSF